VLSIAGTDGSTTGQKTRINRHVTVSEPCAASSPPVMLSVSCLPSDQSGNMSVHVGIGYEPMHIVGNVGADSGHGTR
jgi:hypothetical protein